MVKRKFTRRVEPLVSGAEVAPEQQAQQPTTEEDQIKMLNAENERLKAENAQLRLKNADLQDRINIAKKEVDKALQDLDSLKRLTRS